MQFKWQNMLNLMVSVAFAATSAPVQAVQIQIQQDINFRQMRSGHQVLGILKAGSIIDLQLGESQRQNHPNPNHPGYDSFDLSKTLNYVLNHPEAGQIAHKTINGADVPLFKVSVIRKASGSSYSAGVGSETMIALDYLQRRGKTYVNTGSGTQVTTSEDTTAYSSNDSGFDDSSEARALTTDCPDGSCNRQAGAFSQARLDQLAQLGSITPSTEVASSDQTFDDSSEEAPEPSTDGLQGFHAPGKSLCNQFIKEDGSFGEYGRMALSDIRQHPAFASHNTPFTSICRNYLDFSAAEKEHFQVWVLASLSAHEAGGCKSWARNPGAPHGAALGLLQMEESVSVRRTRPHPFCDGGVDAMKNPANNLSCGIAIMNNGLVAPNLSLYNPSISNNYWRDLITPGETYDLINSYKACGNGQTNYAGGGRRSSGYRSARHHHSKKR